MSLLTAVGRTITQFTEYLETFSRYKQNENLKALSGLLDAQSELTSVEKAMLGTPIIVPLSTAGS